MATRYYLRDTNVVVTCDSAVADVIGDLSKAQGAGTPTGVGSTGSTSWTELMSFDIDVSGDSPISGDYDISIQVDTADDPAQFEYRSRIVQINDTGCVEEVEVTQTGEWTGTGVKTTTITHPTWEVAANRLRLELWGHKVAVHGSKGFTVALNHADSWVDAPWTAGPGPTVVQPKLALMGVGF